MDVTSKRVLVVEDDETLAKLLRYVLTQDGFACGVVHGCADAMDAVETNDFDIVIVDARLRDGNGIELAERIRKTQPGTVTILCSGDPVERSSAVDAFLRMPFEVRELRALMGSAHRHH
jgi:DNA-binding response OmpR family regulator